MADPKVSILKTLQNEGGYQNSPEDTGNWYNGVNYGTKYGITPRDVANYFPDLISDPNCVRNLTEDQAVTIYKAGYWKQHYSDIQDQSIADKLFDLGVLFGVGEAVIIIQLTLGLAQDGAFGPATLAATNSAEPTSLLASYKTNLVTHAFNIATAKPQDRVFLKGWVNRINS